MIQEKDFLYRVPVKTAPITTPGGQIRNPEILVDIEGGEFMHGNILDANSTNKLINQSVKDAVDNKLIESGYVTQDLLDAETTRATEQENSLKTLIGAETSARTKGDEDLSAKIQAEQTRAEGKEKEISDKLAIVDGDSNTEGSFRKAIADVIAAAPEDLDTLKEIADKLADNDDLHTALNQAITDKADASALLNEVTRATGAESNLQAAIDTKADATALSNYVLTAALNQQVDTLNTAISAKQDAGNYIPYDASVQGLYQIDKALHISIGNALAIVQPASIYCKNGTSTISIDDSNIYLTRDGETVRLGESGIILPGGDFNHVLTSNGSTINMDNYAKSSDLSAQLGPKADRTDLMALEKKITANTTAIEGKQDKGNYVAYDNDDGSEYTLKKGLQFSGERTNYVSIDSNGVELNAIGNSSLSYMGLNGSLSGSSYRIGVDGIEVSEAMVSTINIDSGSISLTTNDNTNRFLIDSHGIIIGDTENPNVEISSEGIQFAGKSGSDIPTANGTFIDVNNFASKEDVSSLRVGLSKKQNKITVNEVDITDIETADITKLRTIVTNLINALSESNLIKKVETLE